jgi:hypothetical protein
MTRNCIVITEFWATAKPRVIKARKYEIHGPHQAQHDDIDMRNARELYINHVEPGKRKWSYQTVILLSGTARGFHDQLICYDDNSHYVLIEHANKVLFDSRTVFSCDMQEFAKNRESYVAQMAERGFPRSALDFGSE